MPRKFGAVRYFLIK